MIFNSLEFAFFLPIVFLLYWFVFGCNLRWQNFLVVVASYVFYGWWDWRFLLLIAFTSFCSWGSGILMQSVVTQSAEQPTNRGNLIENQLVKRKRKWIAATNIIINLIILVAFKYYDFFVTEFARMFQFSSDGLLLNVILPVGISFYTFQALSYSIDVYRGKIEATKDIIAFFAYVSFFPQLVAGPIERATNLLPQFEKKRTFEYEIAVDGCRQVLWGLFKKMVVADNCAIYVDQVFGSYQTQSGSTLLLAAILFTFQIYGDFSGYSDIAIGTSKLFGIRLMRNFNVPYFSRDIAEFWRRWHISLTTWFRDYIYIPLGGSRVSKIKVVRNTFIIFLVSGMWHGANWTFLAWGVYHAVLFLPLILMRKNRKYSDVVADNSLLPTIKEFFNMLLTFILVVLGWIIFRAESIKQAWEYVGLLFGHSLFTMPFMYVGTKKAVFFTIIMIFIEWIFRRKEYGLQFNTNTPKLLRVVFCYSIILVILEFAAYSQSFIYFQF